MDSDARIFRFGIKARTGFVNIWQVAMSQYLGVGMFFYQILQQVGHGPFLSLRARVLRLSLGIESTLVAHAQRVAVKAFGMGANQLLVTRLIHGAVACDVVMIAGEPETIRVTADERCHGKVAVAPCGTAVNNNQINLPHDCTAMVPNTVVITVATNLRTLATLVQLTLSIVFFDEWFLRPVGSKRPSAERRVVD